MISVNGESVANQAGQTILALLTQRHAPIDNLVVELNGQIIHRPAFATTTLHTDDRVELISFVGGGR
ncbi:sulfur carrier protein ThiS [Levilactobacillus spicheri]|uniref:Sulfur transfer protein for thiamine biosynthesis n=2 Tax=Levilactobacillus spicheri TaxID=216463 RepID=A0A0F3RS29_9LACO|nr:sulfur carrier protein ThiS [Levilactobacillus spicheri]KJW12409.1 sulfur transfer protein for thiamine biosynthesis [Levilactobacillus spicheri]KRL48810.1 hypothetical protein FD37_GL001276 [Levilactobacillus spicheri DSM 15429]GEO67619.1 hypothetical protein LSP04_20380 [Levilactobacillus spicheri]